MADMSPPDVVVAMSRSAHLNQWGCWVQDVQIDLFDGWTWDESASPKEQAMLVIEEIDRDCMIDLDVGEDGVPVITFGLFEFEPPNLHASLFDLVAAYAEDRSSRNGKIEGQERHAALKLAQALERAASMIRGRCADPESAE